MRIAERYDPFADAVLFHGDCMDLLRAVPDRSIQLVVTSPPYNLGKSYENRIKLSAYVNQQRQVIEECVRSMCAGGSICWQVGNFVDNGEIVPLDIVLYPIFESLGLKLRNRIVWHYGHGLHASKRFSGRYEVVLWFTRDEPYVFNLDPVRVPQKYPSKRHFRGDKAGELSCNPLGKNPTDVWEIPNVKANHVEKTAHPCQFPVELVERLVLSMTEVGDVVLDPYMGVGSTLIAALIHDRRAMGAELFADYVRIAADRIRQAESGELRIRPLERSVFDPSATRQSIPPKYVRLNGAHPQEALFEQTTPWDSDEQGP